MTREELAALKRIIKKDKKYQRMLELYETNPAYVINFKALHDEIDMMHMTRKTRSLRRKSNSVAFAKNVLDAMIDDTAARARCTEILGQCGKISSSMTDTLKNVRDYLLSEYVSSLKRVGTGQERKAFVEAILQKFYNYLSKIETLEKHARLVTEDIDKAGYAYRNIVELIKTLSRPDVIV